MYYFLFQTNTFQGIVVTDLSESYAVYIYNCHDMQFSGSASIGFTSRTYELFANHRLSGYNARNIGCVNSGQSDWVNLVYKLTREDLQPIQPTGIYFHTSILGECLASGSESVHNQHLQCFVFTLHAQLNEVLT